MRPGVLSTIRGRRAHQAIFGDVEIEPAPKTSAISDSNTKDEIKAHLDSLGVEYTSSATKAELLALAGVG